MAEAARAEEAIARARQDQPDLVLLDVALPDRDSFWVCSELKGDPRTAHIPVVMLTAMGLPSDRDRAVEAGADGTSSSHSARARCWPSSMRGYPDGVRAFDPQDFTVRPRARRIDKPWGYEILLTPEGAPYAAKLIHVEAGKRLSLQVHDTKVETQTLVDGRGLLMLEGADGELHEIDMEPGVGYHVAVGQRHRLCAPPDADVTVFEASTPEAGITLRLEDDYARPDETEALRKAERSA